MRIESVASIFNRNPVGQAEGVKKALSSAEDIVAGRRAGVSDVVEISEAAKVLGADAANAASNAKRIFNIIDKDKDGRVGKEDLLSWIKQNKPEGINDKRFDNITAAFERLYNRAISFKEDKSLSQQDFVDTIGHHADRFRNFVANFNAEKTADLAAVSKTSVAVPSGSTNSYFDQIDQDKSGTITKAEYLAWLGTKRPKGVSDQQYNNIANKLGKFFDRASGEKGEVDQAKFERNLETFARRAENALAGFAAAQNNSVRNSPLLTLANKKDGEFVAKSELEVAIDKAAKGSDAENAKIVAGLKQKVLSLFDEISKTVEDDGLRLPGQPKGTINSDQYQYHVLTKDLFNNNEDRRA